MRFYLMLILLGSVAFSSCEKQRLKKPAFLSFHWHFLTGSQEDKASVSAGYFYTNDLHVVGTRETGPDISIEQSLSGDRVSFSEDSDLGLNVAIPMGDYTDFEILLGLSSVKKPAFALQGTYDADGDILPLSIEWSEINSMSFKPEEFFTLQKKKNYTFKLQMDMDRLFDDALWGSATITQGANGPEVVVSETSNAVIFSAINKNLDKSLKLITE